MRNSQVTTAILKAYRTAHIVKMFVTKDSGPGAFRRTWRDQRILHDLDQLIEGDPMYSRWSSN